MARKRGLFLLALLALTLFSQLGCSPLAAGVAGGVVGHAVGKHQNDDDDDDDD